MFADICRLQNQRQRDVFIEQLHKIVCGSGRGFPGTYDLRNCSAHCGRTLNFSTAAGITAASPLVIVTGSIPGASITPHPSTATRICTELRPESSRVVNSSVS